MQNQTLPSIFVHQRQPLERAATGRAVVNEVARPNIVPDPSRLLHTTVRAGARFRPEFSGFSQPYGPLQPQSDPEPMHALDVHGPALADQQSVDPAVSETGMPASQALDLPDQLRFI